MRSRISAERLRNRPKWELSPLWRTVGLMTCKYCGVDIVCCRYGRSQQQNISNNEDFQRMDGVSNIHLGYLGM